jgi:hypothetical protein
MIASDADQLHRIERTLSDLLCRPERDRMRLQRMLKALQLEQLKLLSIDAATGRSQQALGLI